MGLVPLVPVRSKERGCLAILYFSSGRQLQEIGQGTQRAWAVSALSCFQGPRNTLKRLYKVRSLGTATLKLPELGLQKSC